MPKKGVWLLLFAVWISLLWPSFALAQEKKDQSALSMSQPFKLNGFAQMQYLRLSGGVDSFLIRRARLILGGDIIKNLKYKLQVDVSKSSILLDANLDWTVSAYFSLRGGQFKVPFSQENLLSSSDLEVINRSQVEEKLCPGRDIGSQGRDIGAMVFGKYSIVDYQLGIFNGSGINKADTNDQKDLGGRVVVHPIDELSIGAAYYNGRLRPDVESPAIIRKSVHRTGLEFAFAKWDASLKGELILSKDDLISRNGWYLQSGYFFLPKELQAIIRFDSYNKNTDLTGLRSDRFTLGANWYFAERTKFQVNYEHYKIASGTSNWALLAQFQAYF